MLAVLAMIGAPIEATASAVPVHDPADSLPAVESGPAPGPPILYAAAPSIPQLENHDPRFVAPFDRVSGTERYVGGEYLYTDHLYDDHGSDADGDGGGPRAESAGSITYPAAPDAYGGNGADLVELRLSTRGEGLAVRLTLNALLVADAAIATIAFDTDRDPSTGSDTLPLDPGAPFPGTDHVLTTWGNGASWARWAGGRWVQTPLESRADLDANQITVTVPSALIEPAGTWRATAAVGLHDREAGGWLQPGRQGSADRPGGAGPADLTPSGIFNLAFRFHEPALTQSTPTDTAQAAALLAHQPTRFAHDIDLDLLDRRGERSTIPTSGTMIRYYPSRLDLGEGRVWRSRGGAGVVVSSVKVGRLQPYSVHIPSDAATGPVPFTLALHSLNQHHWQYNGSVGLDQMGADRGAVVAVPEGRGGDGWYQRSAEADVFEVWSDLAHHLRLDPDRTTIVGYSMGGYGAYRLAGLYPDLFARAATVVGPPGEGVWLPPAPPVPGGYDTLTNAWLENLRNVPILNLAAALDQIVPIVGPIQQSGGPGVLGLQSLQSLGYRFQLLTFPTADHFQLAALGYDLPMVAEHLRHDQIDRYPDHVTFSYAPGTDDAELGLVHDKAYWVSDLHLADPAVGDPTPKGTIDVVTHGRGYRVPGTAATSSRGSHPLPWSGTGLHWTHGGSGPPTNQLDLRLTNLDAATIHLDRAALSASRPLALHVTTTADARLTLAEGEHRQVVEVSAPGGTIALEPTIALQPQVPDTGGRPGPGRLPTTGPTAGSPGLGALAALAGFVLLHLRRRSVKRRPRPGGVGLGPRPSGRSHAG